MNFHVNDFEGPLDLLLHLVKQSKMDIYEIKISLIIEQYLEIINKWQNLNVDLASSYLVMAGSLLLIKSKMLINKNDEDEETEEVVSEEDLRNKLIAYQMYKDITEEFKALSLKRNEVYTKERTNINEYAEDPKLVNNGITISDLLEALKGVKLREQMLKPVETKITKKELSVSKQVEKIRNLLSKQKKLQFADLFEEYTKDFVVVTFLSILNMSKNKEILLTQDNNFGNIVIERRSEV